MLLYFAIIGVFNLGLGYALAVYLGYGPPSLSAAWHVMDAFMPRAAVRSKVATARRRPR